MIPTLLQHACSNREVSDRWKKTAAVWKSEYYFFVTQQWNSIYNIWSGSRKISLLSCGKVHWGFPSPFPMCFQTEKGNLDNNFTKDKILWFKQIYYCRQYITVLLTPCWIHENEFKLFYTQKPGVQEVKDKLSIVQQYSAGKHTIVQLNVAARGQKASLKAASARPPRQENAAVRYLLIVFASIYHSGAGNARTG